MPELQTSLIFTRSAALKVYKLIIEEGNPALNLRVFITGGGCSGFKYGFTFDEKINADDVIIEKKIKEEGEEDDGGEDSNGGSDSQGPDSQAQVKLLVDSLSFQYLAGAEIDYREDIEGARFVIRNPNAETTCGCGSSFSA